MRKDIIEKVESVVEEAIVKAEAFYLKSIARPKIKFTLKAARINGQYVYRGSIIRVHRNLVANATDEYIVGTLLHEVAHHITYKLFGRVNDAHGDEWSHVSAIIGGDAVVCRDYTTAERGKVRRQRRFEYVCGCSGTVHNISTVRHNRIQRGSSEYTCNKCNRIIKKK